MISEFIKTGDWKGEKHVPVIQAPEKVKSGELVEIKVSIGEEIAHPNTLEHHISWIKLFYVQKDTNVVVELDSTEFKAHGELENFTEPYMIAKVKLPKCGKLIALSYCNIHGLWENTKEITVE